MRAATQKDVRALLFLSRLYESGVGCTLNRCGAYSLALKADELLKAVKDEQESAQWGAEREEAQLRLRELSAVLETSEIQAAKMLLADRPEAADLLESLRPANIRR